MNQNLQRPRRNSFDDYIERGSDEENDSDLSDDSSESNESNENNEKAEEKDKKIEGGFKLSMSDANLKILGIEFIAKFSKLFSNMSISNTKASKSGMGQHLQIDKYVKKVCQNKSEVGKKQSQAIKEEMLKQ